MDKTIKEAFKDSLPIMAGYLVLGAGFGIVCVNAGYSILVALASSVFTYAGSMQFMTVSLLSSGASLISSFITTIAVNLRHMFYGLSMLDKYSHLKKHKLYTIFSLTDETFSLVVSKKLDEDIDSDMYYFYLSLFNQLYWIIGTLIGALLGDNLPFNTNGIDFSMTALFICVLINQWEETSDHFPALIGIFISIICLLIFKENNFLIPSIIIIVLILIVRRELLHE